MGADTGARRGRRARCTCRRVPAVRSRRAGTGTGSRVCVLIVHGVAWSGISRIRYGSPPASSASTTGPMTSASQRSSASTFTSSEPWWPASSVASTCSDEEVAIVERAMHTASACARVVVVEARGRAGHVDDLDAGEHAEALHEVDRRRHAARDAVGLARTTAARASRPGPTARSASRSSRRSRPRRARPARDASISALQLRRRRARPGTRPRRPVRSCGGVHSASAHSRGTTHRWRYSTPGWKRTPSRPPPSAASSAATIGWLCSLVEVARPRSRP